MARLVKTHDLGCRNYRPLSKNPRDEFLPSYRSRSRPLLRSARRRCRIILTVHKSLVLKPLRYVNLRILIPPWGRRKCVEIGTRRRGSRRRSRSEEGGHVLDLFVCDASFAFDTSPRPWSSCRTISCMSTGLLRNRPPQFTFLMDTL